MTQRKTDRVETQSAHPLDERLEHLKQLYPEAVTEDGIDFDALRNLLGIEFPQKERYQFTWAGKQEALLSLQKRSKGTLKPVPEESVNWDSTGHLFIEGDNLEVLKLLYKSYFGRVKMIYIDPPYNTGGDFVYPDNYADPLGEYLRITAQVDEQGNRQTSRQELNGRKHSAWLSMMYPRLFVARQLLRDDGVIFVSIDDNEVHNLRFILNEIFGEENFIDCIIWKKRYGGGAKEKHLVSLHEYVLFYAKNIEYVDPIFIPTAEEKIDRYYKQQDDNFEVRGPYRTHPLEATKSMGDRPNLVFPIPAPDGTEVMPKRQWLWGKERTFEALKRGELEFIRSNDKWTVHTKQYLRDENGTVRSSKAFSIIDDVYTQHGTNEIIDLFGDAQVFPFPKPVEFIKKLINIGTETNGEDVVLDFFSGSASTAHA
ncbi:site-specific DNA-methyltransferase, partial [bacterium]|nr:site-specific DNA-methyltransferase [bacterium]